MSAEHPNAEWNAIAREALGNALGHSNPLITMLLKVLAPLALRDAVQRAELAAFHADTPTSPRDEYERTVGLDNPLHWDRNLSNRLKLLEQWRDDWLEQGTTLAQAWRRRKPDPR